MPTILAIETSTELASAALLAGGRVISRQTSGVQNHSQTILPMVQELLAEAGIGLAACDAIAFGCGPGSFTGVRTACGIVQGLAFGASLPVVPVVTLQAMAQACHEDSGATDVLAVLDARMGEVYWAQYRQDSDGSWQTVSVPALSVPEAVMAIRGLGPVLACGNGLLLGVAASPEEGSASDLKAAIMPHAIQVARLGAQVFSAGGSVPASQAQPLYLRNKVAMTTAERRAKAAQ